MALNSNTLIWRYTSLSSLINILREKKLTLLPPDSWEDKNDVYFLSEYKQKQNLKSVHALCFSMRSQTYQQWHVFAKGAEGVCIAFNRAEMLRRFSATPDLAHGPIDYHDLRSAKNISDISKLPFIKQKRYGGENEYRIISVSQYMTSKAPKIAIDRSCFSRITLSPWLHPSLVASIKSSIKEIDGMSTLDVRHSTLISFNSWRNIVSNFS